MERSEARGDQTDPTVACGPAVQLTHAHDGLVGVRSFAGSGDVCRLRLLHLHERVKQVIGFRLGLIVPPGRELIFRGRCVLGSLFQIVFEEILFRPGPFLVVDVRRLFFGRGLLGLTRRRSRLLQDALLDPDSIAAS